MRRAERLFDIIQNLRAAKAPLTAERLAADLEVTTRTIYRDVAALQASRVPIKGAPGIGYVLRRGFELPPLMFTEEEIEAIAVGTRLIARTGDPGLEKAADSVLVKIAAVLPQGLGAALAAPPFYVSKHGAPTPPVADLRAIRIAVRDGRKLGIAYEDAAGNLTERTVWPVAVAYCVESTLLAAWCELRQDFRHFRTDRIRALKVRVETVPVDGVALRAAWRAQTIRPARTALQDQAAPDSRRDAPVDREAPADPVDDALGGVGADEAPEMRSDQRVAAVHDCA
ncbi:MAG: helix-turn-helix transcriptional regulator [Acetobacteraceae bacterium]